jgi:hypothetical protein
MDILVPLILIALLSYRGRVGRHQDARNRREIVA